MAADELQHRAALTQAWCICISKVLRAYHGVGVSSGVPDVQVYGLILVPPGRRSYALCAHTLARLRHALRCTRPQSHVAARELQLSYPGAEADPEKQGGATSAEGAEAARLEAPAVKVPLIAVKEHMLFWTWHLWLPAVLLFCALLVLAHAQRCFLNLLLLCSPCAVAPRFVQVLDVNLFASLASCTSHPELGKQAFLKFLRWCTLRKPAMRRRRDHADTCRHSNLLSREISACGHVCCLRRQLQDRGHPVLPGRHALRDRSDRFRRFEDCFWLVDFRRAGSGFSQPHHGRVESTPAVVHIATLCVNVRHRAGAIRFAALDVATSSAHVAITGTLDS